MSVTSQYSALVDSLYTSLEALDASDYVYGPGERWHRDYYVLPEQRAKEHLAAGVVLGEITFWGNDRLEQGASIAFACRFSGSPDSTVQGKLQAAQNAVMTMLTTWVYGDARAEPIATFIEPLTPGLEWLEVVCTFKLSMNRG